MASWPPKKNAVFTFYVGLISQADTKLLQANPTLAAGDVKVATDDAAPGNLATLPVVDADLTDRVKVSMSAGEMNGDRITVIFSDAAGAEWADLLIDIPTTVRQIDDLAFPTVTGRSTDVLATGEVPVDFDTSIGTLAAAQIEASALDGKGDWNIGKTGYSLTQAFPTNFADLSIVVTTGLVDITQTAADKVWSTATRTLTAFSTTLALSVWDVLESAIVTASTIGLKVKNNLDAAITTRASQATVDNIENGVGIILADTADMQPRVAAIEIDVTGINGDAMRGTNSALLASAAPTNFGDLSIAVTTGLVDLVADQSAVTVGTVNALGATAKTDVNAEVVDVMTVDTIAELTAGIPAATPTIVTALMLPYMAFRNKMDVTASFLEVHNNAGAVIAKKALSDDGVTYSEAEAVAGP